LGGAPWKFHVVNKAKNIRTPRAIGCRKVTAKMKLRFGIVFALLAVLVVGASVGGVGRAEAAAQLGQDFPSFTPAPYNYQPLGFAQISITSSAQTFAVAGVAVPTGARLAVMTVDAANVRYRDDGTAPTASIGIQLSSSATQPYEYSGDLAAIQSGTRSMRKRCSSPRQRPSSSGRMARSGGLRDTA
jgi:hypothetical protein